MRSQPARRAFPGLGLRLPHFDKICLKWMDFP